MLVLRVSDGIRVGVRVRDASGTKRLGTKRLGYEMSGSPSTSLSLGL